jgi:hypothetical protein
MIEAAAPKDEIEAALAVSDGLHTYSRHGGSREAGRSLHIRAASCRLRIGCGSFDEGLCDPS